MAKGKRVTADERKRLEAAVDRYHGGPGVYGAGYLRTCLRLAGLGLVTLKPRKASK